MSHILSVNAGSTSVKYKLFDGNLNQILSGRFEKTDGHFESILIKHGKKYKWQISEDEFCRPVDLIQKELAGFSLSKVGFRIVHGGEIYKEPTQINEEFFKNIKELSSLAPLHNPPALKVISEFLNIFETIPMYAVFDTAFHQSMKPEQFLYSLPYDFYTDFKIRKYGFHGISHEYIYSEISKLEKKHEKVISCHLGGGASITAILNGKSFDNSMGFTPLEGLTMGTRAGDIDSGVVLYMIENLKYSIDDVKRILNNASGLIGISGVSSDMRELIELSGKGDERAKLAIDVYVYDVVRYIGSYATAMGGVDALVFSGGVGSGSDIIRAKICEKLSTLRVKLAKSKNNGQINVDKNLKINNRGSIPVWVIPTDEEKMIAKKILSL